VTPADRLTAQQRRVLIAVADGLSNTEIGARLYITEDTVKTHMRHIFSAIGTRSRARAAALAVAWGIADPTTSTPAPSEPPAPEADSRPVLVSGHLIQRAAAVAVAGAVGVLSVEHQVEVSDHRIRQMIADAVRRAMDRLADDRTGGGQ
jgi:DNA-binding CsgD family transcriptional regulator